jgi:hypothetical protein
MMNHNRIQKKQSQSEDLIITGFQLFTLSQQEANKPMDMLHQLSLNTHVTYIINMCPIWNRYRVMGV